LFKWKKLGKVFSPQAVEGRNWLAEFAQAPATLAFDDYVRIYFSCRPPADANGQYISRSAWVDVDRRNPTTVLRIADCPILPLGGLGEFDEFGTYPVSVIRHDLEVWAYYGGWTRCESVPFNVAIGMAISRDDGTTFKRVGKGPVLSYTPDEPFILSGPKVRRFGDTLYLWYIAGRKWKVVDGRPEPVYKIRMATSTDGIRWSKINRDLIENRIDVDEAQASPDVFFAGNKYHMFFCYRYSVGFRGREFGYRIGYAWSTDLFNWTRDDERAGIDVADEGWDSEMVSYPHVFEIDQRVFMAYLGNQVGKYGFGLAELEGTLV
jgi:hypothetical protein